MLLLEFGLPYFHGTFYVLRFTFYVMPHYTATITMFFQDGARYQRASPWA